MEIMAEDWVRLELGMHLQIGVLQYIQLLQRLLNECWMRIQLCAVTNFCGSLTMTVNYKKTTISQL